MKKPSPSLTWRHQDTSVRTNGTRLQATVSWALGLTPVCASCAQGLGVRRRQEGLGGQLGQVAQGHGRHLLSEWRGPRGGMDRPYLGPVFLQASR